MTLKLRMVDIPLFQCLTTDEVAELGPLAKVIEKKQGEVVLLIGENVPGVFIVAEGEVGVFPENAQKKIASIKAGGCFGEMSFLEKLKASATIRAESEVAKLVIFEKAILDKKISENYSIGMHFNRGITLALSQKLRDTNERIAGELRQGRDFYRKLADIDGSLSSIAKVRETAGERFLGIKAHLEKATALLDELKRELPERAGAISDVNIGIQNAHQELAKTERTLLQQVTAMVQFIESVEGFLLASTHINQ